MANEFSITTATNAVQLDSQNQAIATFTIFNASGSTVSGRAALATVPDSQAFASWLQIDGSAERSFDIGGTEQYVIKIVAPADTPAGSYTFRLNMVETENPDEGFNPGPSITFTVPEPVEPTSTFPMWIIPAIIGALLVIGAIIYFATRGPGTVEVPNIVGMSGDDAQDALEDAGLRQRQGPSDYSSAIAEGLVARSDPPAGEMVEPNSRVLWLLSDGREPTPTLTPTLTPSPTSTPSPTPPPTPNATATSQALIDASIKKYLGDWEISSGSGFLTRLTVSEDSQTIIIEGFGTGYYVDGDANSVAAVACPLTFPQTADDCFNFAAKGPYQGDPISLKGEGNSIVFHLLTISVTENGEVLSVVDQVQVNDVTIATDVYAMKRPAPVLFVPIITISAVDFIFEFPQLVVTPSP